MAANPLSKLVLTEDRVDGVYLKIGRLEKERVRLDELIKLLEDALVLNYDSEKIADVYSRARGMFEKIGPLFECYDPELEQHVQLTFTQEKATLFILPTSIAAGIQLTERRLSHFLAKKGVKSGIRSEQLRKLCSESILNTSVEVASATKPVPGEDAALEFLVAIDLDARPLVRDNGKADFREIQSFVSVSAKQMIARKKPATRGIPGTSISGDPIPATPGKDVLMPAGRNTEISADGTALFAAKTGIIYQENGVLNIIELLDIKGDVDFSVGNIKYSGDVVIHGNVLPGFVIEAEGSVDIRGEVESARVISRNGFVCIERGIIGKGDTVISAKKGITVAFAQEATLSTEGILVVEKYLLHCECTCLSLQTKDHHGGIIGGRVNAEKSVETGHLGSDKGVKTAVTLFDSEKKVYDQKLCELITLEKKLMADLEPIDKQLKTKSAMLKKFQDEVSGRQVAEVKKWIDAFNSVNTKIKYVRQKTEETRKQIELTKTKTHDGYVKVAGNVYPGTELDLYDKHFAVSTIMTNTRFKLNKSEVEYGA